LLNHPLTTLTPRAQRLHLLRRHASRIERRLAAAQRLSTRYSWARLIAFFAGVAVSLIIFFVVGQWLFWPVLVTALLLFGVFVHLHQRIEAGVQRFSRLRELMRHQIARSTVDWTQLPTPRAVDIRHMHPFEGDLDLVGQHSLHRLLDLAASAQGSARLRAWLTQEQPELVQTQDRQGLIQELLRLTNLRHKLAVDGRLLVENDAGWEATHLLAWLEQAEPPTRLRRWLVGLSLLAVINLALFAADRWTGTGPWWRYSLLIYVGLYMVHNRSISETFHHATAVRDDLQRLLVVFRPLERFNLTQFPALQQLCAPLQDRSQRPSQLLRQIVWVAAGTGVQGNPLISLILNAIAPWGLFFAYRLEQLRVELAGVVPHWLEIWYELEALSSLANAAYLDPALIFPTVRADERAPVFVVEGLGHPLLSPEQKVRNNFEFRQLGDLAILTGSNMAGKSTFLKALGVNLALANAGGVVDAGRFDTTLFRLFTCIKVSDSVTDGISYFYAEVRRLKALLMALEEPNTLPLFFCIDEIFRGTNNRERLLGSRAYIRALVQGHGVGLIATHDLELVKLADEAPQIANFHFRDDLADGQMVFDYRLRPGPSPTTNALKLMRSAGLPVAEGEGADPPP
jgi:hypothetical protein